MKPLQLVMQAFGPFAGRETVDFEALGEAPLFLINGPTGSGKSTILDAICFALYGSTTGAEREGSEMRCQHSPEDLLTEVSLTFELARTRYRIVRQPLQSKPKQRGQGVTEHKPQATLWRLDNSGDAADETLLVEQKVQQANRAIIDLTGLNADQFRQVMVLPQGQFRKLLLADSGERERIFQSLFQTDIYKQIEDRLKQDAASIRKAFEAGSQRLAGILDAVGLASESDLDTELTKTGQLCTQRKKDYDRDYQHWEQEEHALVAVRALKQTLDRLAQEQTRQSELLAREAHWSEQRARIAAAKEAAPLAALFKQQDAASAVLEQVRGDLARTAADLSVAEQQQRVTTVALEQATVAWAERDTFYTALGELRAMVPEVERWRAITQSLAKSNEQLAQARQEHDGQRQRRAQLLQQRDELREKIEVTETALRDSETVEQELFQAQQALGLARQRDDIDKRLQQRRAQQQTLLAERSAHQQVLEEAGQTLLRLRRDWHLGQARVLARALQEGEPCPVCGSSEHPAPASGDLDGASVPDEAALEQQEAHCTRLRAQLEQSSARLAVIDSECEQLQQQRARLVQELGASAEQAREVFIGAEQSAQQALDLRQETRRKLNYLREQRDDCEASTRALEQALQSAAATYEQVEREQVSLQAALAQSAARVPEQYRRPGELEAAIGEHEAQIQQLDDRLAAAREQSSQAQQQLASVTTRRDHAQTAQLQAAEALAAATQAAADALQASRFADRVSWQQAQLDPQALEQLEQALQAADKALADCRVAIATLEAEIGGREVGDITQLEQAQKARRLTRDQTWQLLQEAEQRRGQLEDVRSRLARQRQANADIEQRYRVLGTLAEVASGQSGSKVSLHRYVLGALLDDVLAQASRRLSNMSGGRYQLLRKQDPNKRGRAAGLDLEVHDDYSGATRPVATLSGGESFLAALALALGLSDVVQAQAGGIALDTLFIDEGFGSLDSESLELAVQTLLDLQRAGRTVGIISHVRELREQFDVRIDLRTARDGSHLRLVAPMLRSEPA